MSYWYIFCVCSDSRACLLYVNICDCDFVCVCVFSRALLHTHTHIHVRHVFNVMRLCKFTCMCICMNVMFILDFIHLLGPFLVEAISHRPLTVEFDVRT